MEGQKEQPQAYRNDPIVPVEQRDMTDLPCLIIYLIFVVVMLAFGIYAWVAGNFAKLTTAYDPDGKGCGVDYPNYPYIYFASPHSNSLWVTVCLAKCPVAGDTVLYCQPNSVVTSCNPVPNTGNNAAAVQIYPTSLFANTICLPTSATLRATIGSAFGTSTAAMTSLMQNYALVLFGIPIAIIVALIFMVIIRYCAAFFVYVLIFLAVSTLVGFGVYLCVAPTNPVTGSPAGTAGSIVAAVICFLLAFLLVLLICCYRHRIALATSIIKISANFVFSNCGVVFLPLLLFFVTLIFLTVWVLQALGFYSLGTPYTAAHQYPFQHFQITAGIRVLFCFHVFYLLWTLMFLVETSTFIIGGTATNWYYQRNDPYSDASERYRKKHIGSVVFGGLLLVLLGILRLIYEALFPQSEDGTVSCWKKCCDCLCFLCVRLFEWFTTGAFTVINIRGTPFCSSGEEALGLKLQSLGTSSIVAVVQAIFTLLVRLGITFLTMLIVYILIKAIPAYQQSVSDATLIMVVVGFCSFTISCFFVSVYSDAIEAVYMTYLVDRERGDSARECPQDLREFLEQADRAEKGEQSKGVSASAEVAVN